MVVHQVHLTLQMLTLMETIRCHYVQGRVKGTGLQNMNKQQFAKISLLRMARVYNI